MDSRPDREPPVREDTPDETSSTPVSSRRAQDWSKPRGPNSRESSRARPVSTPVRLSMRMITVKNSTKAQMFRVEARAPVTEWVKAVGKEAV